MVRRCINTRIKCTHPVFTRSFAFWKDYNLHLSHKIYHFSTYCLVSDLILSQKPKPDFFSRQLIPKGSFSQSRNERRDKKCLLTEQYMSNIVVISIIMTISVNNVICTSLSVIMVHKKIFMCNTNESGVICFH